MFKTNRSLLHVHPSSKLKYSSALFSKYTNITVLEGHEQALILNSLTHWLHVAGLHH